MSRSHSMIVRQLGIQPYGDVLRAMHRSVIRRKFTSPDEIWLLQHFAVFTRGRGAREEDLSAEDAVVSAVRSDRGGKVTYHGPGQQIMYLLLNLPRFGWRTRDLIGVLEKTVINTLARLGIEAHADDDRPGIYVGPRKICAFGLRVCRGWCTHGLALNVRMDLSPFSEIDPCGQSGIGVTQVSEWFPEINLSDVSALMLREFLTLAGVDETQLEFLTTCA